MNKRITRVSIEFLEQHLGEYEDRKDWRNFRCPFHFGERFNFGINLKSGVYKCLGCASEGKLSDLVRDLGRGSVGSSVWGGGILSTGEKPEWTESISSAAGRASRVDTLSIPELDRWFSERWQRIDTAPESVSKEMAIKYLKKRRIDIDRFEVGLMDDLPGRVVFPFRLRSLVCYYMGRAFVNIGPKTVNPDVDKGWPGKGQILFNYDNLGEKIILCEGVFDAITAETELKIPATCLLGKTITDRQKRMLKEKGVRYVTVMLDSDARPDAIKLSLELYKSGFVVNLVDWRILKTEAKDPNDCTNSDLEKLYENASDVNYLTEIRFLAE